MVVQRSTLTVLHGRHQQVQLRVQKSTVAICSQHEAATSIPTRLCTRLLKHFRWQCKMTSVPCTMCFRSLRPSRWPRSLKFPAPVTSSVLVPLRQGILPRPTIPSRISTRCLFTTPKRDVQYTRFPDQHQRTSRPHDQAARIIVFIAIAGAVYYVAQ